MKKLTSLVLLSALVPVAEAGFHHKDRRTSAMAEEQRRQLAAELMNLRTARGCVENAGSQAALRACESRLRRDHQEAGIVANIVEVEDDTTFVDAKRAYRQELSQRISGIKDARACMLDAKGSAEFERCRSHVDHVQAEEYDPMWYDDQL